MTYAKLKEGGRVDFLRRVPNVTNCTDETLARYAVEHGYKEYVSNPAPGRYYNETHSMVGDRIVQQWTPWELDTAKQEALRVIQEKLNASLAATVSVPCEGIPAGIDYNQQATINALGIKQGDMWIDSANQVHLVDEALIGHIKKALTDHHMSLYAKAQYHRDAVEAAKDVLEVEKAQGDMELDYAQFFALAR